MATAYDISNRWVVFGFVKGHVQYIYYYLRFFTFSPPKYAYYHNKHKRNGFTTPLLQVAT